MYVRMYCTRGEIVRVCVCVVALLDRHTASGVHEETVQGTAHQHQQEEQLGQWTSTITGTSYNQHTYTYMCVLHQCCPTETR